MARITKTWAKKIEMVAIKPVCDICGKPFPEYATTAEDLEENGVNVEGGIDMILNSGISFTIQDMSGPAEPAIGFSPKYDFLCINCYNKYIEKIIKTIAKELNFELD